MHLPWTGIVVNISAKSADSKVQDGDYWLKEFANSAKVHMLWDEKHQTSQATVQFQSNWDGFTKATDFEKFFEGQDHGKSAWKASEQDLGSNIYGWRVRRDDYDSEGPIGEYLHKETKLRTISGIVQENAASRNTVVATLTEKIAETNQNLDKLQSMYNENAMSLSRRLEDKDSCTVILLKREKEVALNKIIQLEKQLDAKQKLEMEIQELKGKLNVMKHLEDQDDAAVKKTMKEYTDELEQKMEDLSSVETLNQTLIVKERQSNGELQEARKILIQALLGTSGTGRSNIGIKSVEKCFRTLNILSPKCYGVVDEDDEKLKGLRKEYGVEIYNAVVTAFMELIEYNPSDQLGGIQFLNYGISKKEGKLH
ncbi:Factor of DNA methylation 1 [Linum perenne]